MRRVALVLLALCACGGDALPDGEFTLRVHVPATEVAFGVAFLLTVEGVWRSDLLPEPIRDEAFAPLRVRLRDATRREVGDRIAETRRYDAFAFARGEVTLPALTWKARPRAGGDERATTSEAITLRVTPALTPDAALAPELPGDLLVPETPRPRWPWLLVAMLPLAAWLAWRARGRARAVVQDAPPPLPPTEPAHARALERVAALRAWSPHDDTGIEAWCAEAVQLARDYVSVRFAVPAPEMTTDELLAALPHSAALAETPRTHLTRLCQRGDLVKFARLRLAADARHELLADAEAFVRGTAVAEATP